MNVIITGVAGFIGSHLLKRIMETTDWKVVGIDDFSRSNASRLSKIESPDSRFRLIPVDLCLLSDRFELESTDIIFHLAAHGSVPDSMTYPLHSFRNNVESFATILELARISERKPKIVYASSSSIYGEHCGLHSEVHPPAEIPKNPYALSKIVNEMQAKTYHTNFGLDAIGLRLFNVYGPWQELSVHRTSIPVIPAWIKSIKNGQPVKIFGDGRQIRHLTYVDDVANAFIKAATAQAPRAWNGVYNISGPEDVEIIDLAGRLLELMGKERIMQFENPRAGDRLSSRADIEKAMKLLDWQPKTDLRSGLAATVEAFVY